MRLSRAARIILEDFSGAYPLSAHYRGGRKLRRSNLQNLFPEMDTNVEVKEEVLDGVEELSRGGIISVRWKRFRERTDPEAVYLEDPEKLYELLGTPSPKMMQHSMAEILRKRLFELSASHIPELEPAPENREYRLCDALLAELEADQPLPAENPETLGDLLPLFRLKPRETEDVTLRGLSIRMFGDSKRLEALLPAADRISRKYFGSALSDELGLKRSFPEASFSLFGRIISPGGRVWECGGEMLSLPLSELLHLQGITPLSGSVPAVLSIENKETFHVVSARNRRLPELRRFSCVVYSGGYPDGAVRFLIRHLSEQGGRMFHFGDLDPEGLLIFQDIAGIVRTSGGELRPFLMSPEIYRKYLRYGRPLTGVQRERLIRVTCPMLIPLAGELESWKIGVEQEVINPDREGLALPGEEKD